MLNFGGMVDGSEYHVLFLRCCDSNDRNRSRYGVFLSMELGEWLVYQG